jgi:hypothetical protein
MNCEVEGCARTAAIRLDDPRGPNLRVCPAHGRVMVQREGVVAEVIEGADAEFP